MSTAALRPPRSESLRHARAAGALLVALLLTLLCAPAFASSIAGDEARDWLYRALAGDPEAQFSIAGVYERIGDGWQDDLGPPPDARVPVADYAGGNYMRAYAWYAVAARQHVVDAEHRRQAVAARLSAHEREAVDAWLAEVLVPVIAVVSAE